MAEGDAPSHRDRGPCLPAWPADGGLGRSWDQLLHTGTSAEARRGPGAFLLDPASLGMGLWLSAQLLSARDLAFTTTGPTSGIEDGYGGT